MNHLRETLGKHSGSFQHCHPSVQSSSKAETFQSSVQGIQKTSLKQFWWAYAPDIRSSKNDYSYWALGTVYSFPGMYYENKYKYYLLSLHLNNIENLMMQENTKYCKHSQKKHNYVWNLPESRRKEFAQPAVSCCLKFSNEIIYLILMTHGELVTVQSLTVSPNTSFMTSLH